MLGTIFNTIEVSASSHHNHCPAVSYISRVVRTVAAASLNEILSVSCEVLSVLYLLVVLRDMDIMQTPQEYPLGASKHRHIFSGLIEGKQIT